MEKKLQTYRCEQCNKEFERHPSQRKGKHIFCSRPCQHKWRVGDRVENYKGDNVGYGGLHAWVKSRLTKPDHCLECKQPEKFGKDGRSLIDLANISGEYKRDLSDWTWWCRKCHMRKDDNISKRKFRNRINCMRGHLYSEVGYYKGRANSRVCRACNKIHYRRWFNKKKQNELSKV